MYTNPNTNLTPQCQARKYRLTGGWMDGWTDGWMDGWMYGWMDGPGLELNFFHH